MFGTRVRVLVLAVVVCVAVVLGLVFGGAFRSHSGRPTSGRSTGTYSGGTSVVPPPPAGVKPIIRGLIDRQGPPASRMLSVVHAYVVKVNWADLQPTPFGPIAPDNAIDKAIARVRLPHLASVGMMLKLRVFAGIDAPEWAKSLGGAPVPYVDNQAGASVAGGTIGRFWTPEFGRAYADLESKLAAKYDAVPAIREVNISRCSTIFDESFARQVGDKRNAAALRAAGYTVAADQACIAASLQAHTVWRHTTSDMAFAPFPSVDNPSAARDLAFPFSMMRECRAILGVRCGLQNNSLASSKLATSQFTQFYAQMTTLGPPLILQTDAASRIGDPAQVLAAAVAIKANSVELPSGYPKWSMTLLEDTAAALGSNPAPH